MFLRDVGIEYIRDSEIGNVKVRGYFEGGRVVFQ